MNHEDTETRRRDVYRTICYADSAATAFGYAVTLSQGRIDEAIRQRVYSITRAAVNCAQLAAGAIRPGGNAGECARQAQASEIDAVENLHAAIGSALDVDPQVMARIEYGYQTIVRTRDAFTDLIEAGGPLPVPDVEGLKHLYQRTSAIHPNLFPSLE